VPSRATNLAALAISDPRHERLDDLDAVFRVEHITRFVHCLAVCCANCVADTLNQVILRRGGVRLVVTRLDDALDGARSAYRDQLLIVRRGAHRIRCSNIGRLEMLRRARNAAYCV
jgi:hypothetical protein